MARRKGIHPQKVTLTRADAYDLAPIVGTFTGAFAVDWLAHVPQSRIESFLAGLHRRLAPGARIAFCDQTPGATSLTGAYDAEGNHLQERELPDGSRHGVCLALLHRNNVVRGVRTVRRRSVSAKFSRATTNARLLYTLGSAVMIGPAVW